MKSCAASGTVHLVACGTAMHAGMVGKTAIESAGPGALPRWISPASSATVTPSLNPEDLVIIISQSGETSDTLAALKLAKSRGVPVLAIVNVVGSSIARAADYVLYTYAGPEIAVASTKAYMVQLCVLYLFSAASGLRQGPPERGRDPPLDRRAAARPESHQGPSGRLRADQVPCQPL